MLKGKRELFGVPKESRAPHKISFSEPHICSERYHEKKKKETENPIHWHGDSNVILNAGTENGK